MPGAEVRWMGYDGYVLRSLYRPADARTPAGRPERGLVARLAMGAVAAVVVAVPFTLLMLLVLSEWEPLDRLDRGVADDLNKAVRDDPTVVDALEVTAVVTSPWFFRITVLATAVWLWRRQARRLALWAVVTAAVGGTLGVLLKLLVERSRPAFPEPVASASGYSFPSGHALNSMLCVGILILVFLPVLTRRGKTVAYSVGAALVLLTGYDRIALGVHYVSDVIAGWAVALATIAGTAIAFEVWRREHGRRPSTVEEGVEPEAAASISDPPTATE
ncbi:MAG: phosphatase PAP2 family protein [Actinomycetes bacterium]